MLLSPRGCAGRLPPATFPATFLCAAFGSQLCRAPAIALDLLVSCEWSSHINEKAWEPAQKPRNFHTLSCTS